MEVYDHAFGKCAHCSADIRNSLYWTPLPDAVWRAIRPFFVPLFQDADHVQNVLFVPEYSKPFCSPDCGLAWYQKHGGFDEQD